MSSKEYLFDHDIKPGDVIVQSFGPFGLSIDTYSVTEFPKAETYLYTEEREKDFDEFIALLEADGFKFQRMHFENWNPASRCLFKDDEQRVYFRLKYQG